jgi:hypothetical protein
VMALVLALTWETEDYSVYTEKVGNTYWTHIWRPNY